MPFLCQGEGYSSRYDGTSSPPPGQTFWWDAVQIEDARGKRADGYLLGLPEQFKALAKATVWRTGKIYGIRTVFRALVAPLALVCEAVERGRHFPTSAGIVRATGLSRPTVAKELNILVELSMIERRHGVWRIIHTTNRGKIAECPGSKKTMSGKAHSSEYNVGSGTPTLNSSPCQ